MTVLVLTTVLPGERRGGGEIVSQHVVDALVRARREVRVVGYRRPEDTASTGAVELCAGRRPIETSAAGPRALAWMARALIARAPYSVAKYRSRAYLRTVRRALGDGVTTVLLDHAQTHFAIEAVGRAHRPLVFIAHNVEAEMYAQLSAAARGSAGRWLNGREARLIRRAEEDLAGRARQVWTLTAEDAALFRSLRPGADVRTLEVPSRIVEPVEEAIPEYDVALIGSWRWQANARGLQWFSAEVVPRLPVDLTIEVAGGGAEWLRGRHPNVAVRGVVPDAQRFLSRARVIAVPAVAGGGVQVKTLDAIASGVAVVATATATRGLKDLPASLVVADEADEFAGHLRRLAAEAPRDRLRAEAIAWSSARRERFDSAVASWVGELVDEP